MQKVSKHLTKKMASKPPSKRQHLIRQTRSTNSSDTPSISASVAMLDDVEKKFKKARKNQRPEKARKKVTKSKASRFQRLASRFQRLEDSDPEEEFETDSEMEPESEMEIDNIANLERSCRGLLSYEPEGQIMSISNNLAYLYRLKTICFLVNFYPHLKHRSTYLPQE